MLLPNFNLYTPFISHAAANLQIKKIEGDLYKSVEKIKLHLTIYIKLIT
jgi:hypothetical protein